MSRLFGAGMACLALAFAGCSGSDDSDQSSQTSDEEQIKAASMQFYDSIESGDFAKGCEVLTRASVKLYEEGVGSCENALKMAKEQFSTEDFAKARVIEDIEINGTTAVIKGPGVDNSTFEKVNGEWQIDVTSG